MKSLIPARPVLWFLFLFNAAVAIAVVFDVVPACFALWSRTLDVPRSARGSYPGMPPRFASATTDPVDQGVQRDGAYPA